MATTASSVTSVGTYLANGSFDEISTTASTNGLVGYWNSSIGYYGTGNVWSDLTNNNNNFMLSASTYSSNNIVFTGTANSFAYNTIPQIANASFVTVEIIVNSPISSGMFFGFGAYDVYTAGATLGFNTGQSNVYGLTAAEVTALGIRNVLTHYVFVMVGLGGNIPASNQIWINGVQQTLTNAIGTTTTNGRGFNYYGSPNIVLNGWAVPDSQDYRNSITYKSVRIYNRALSTAEIQQNYNVIAASIGKSPLATPPTMTVYPTTITVSGSYDEVTYNPTNVNLLSFSQQLDTSSYWFQGTSCTVLPNVVNAPDNTLTADKIVQNTTNQRHGLQSPTIPVIANTAYTVSCYAKAGENNFVQLVYGKQGSPFTRGGSVVNLTTGAVTNYVVGSPTSVVRGTPEFVGNGWWYIYLTVIIDATSTDGYVEVNTVNSSANGSGYIGSNSTDGTYVWGMQLEQNTKATTYQVTPPASPPPNLYNLLTYSQDFSNVIWGKGGATTITANAATAPNGTNTAFRVQMPASSGTYLEQYFTAVAGQTYTFSLYARYVAPTNTQFSIFVWTSASTGGPASGSGTTNITTTAVWTRYSVQFTAPSTGSFGVAIDNTGNTLSPDVYIWGAQLEQGSTASIYQGVSAQNTLITGFAKRDTQAGITYVTDKFDEFTKILPVTSGLILNLDSTRYNGGTTWQNQTVNNYNATLINNPAYNTENGGIIKFNTNIYTSTPQYVTTTIPSNTFTPSSNWTMSTWVRFNASNTSIAYLNPRSDGFGFWGTSGNLLGCVDYGNYGLFWTTNVYNNVRGFYAGSMVRTGSPYSESNIQTSNLTFGVWYNVTGVYDYTGNSHKLYINGALVNTGPVVTTGTFQNFASIPFIGSGTDAVYGGNSSGKVLDGDLGQNLIYNRALTAQEVLDNYNALRGRYSSSDIFTGKVVDGLVAYYDPAYSSSYSGVGATLYNLVDGVAATLNGTYSASTIPVGSSVSGNQTIRLTNSDLVAAGNNISHIQAPSFTNITTVSIWFYQHTYNGISRYILDGRTGGSEGWIYNSSIGSNWSTGTTYVNGGASSGTPLWSNWGGDQIGVWKNVTFIANTPFTDDINIFSRFTDNEGLDVTFGAILIYNRVLTQAENAQNFNTLRGRYGV